MRSVVMGGRRARLVGEVGGARVLVVLAARRMSSRLGGGGKTPGSCWGGIGGRDDDEAGGSGGPCSLGAVGRGSWCSLAILSEGGGVVESERVRVGGATTRLTSFHIASSRARAARQLVLLVAIPTARPKHSPVSPCRSCASTSSPPRSPHPTRPRPHPLCGHARPCLATKKLTRSPAASPSPSPRASSSCTPRSATSSSNCGSASAQRPSASASTATPCHSMSALLLTLDRLQLRPALPRRCVASLALPLPDERSPLSLSPAGHYDGVPFHRILPGFIAQTGGGDDCIYDEGSFGVEANQVRSLPPSLCALSLADAGPSFSAAPQVQPARPRRHGGRPDHQVQLVPVRPPRSRSRSSPH